jgi:hypothetical protein
MRKRYLIVAALFALLASVGFVAALVMSNGPGVTKASFDRIEKGMTLQEVEQIFGRAGTPTWGGYWWQADDGAKAYVWFGSGEHARQINWEHSTESWLDQLRRWLHLH